MINYISRILTYFSIKEPEVYNPSRENQRMAVGPCPVKVVGISKEDLKKVGKISPDLEARMSALAAPRSQKGLQHHIKY